MTKAAQLTRSFIQNFSSFYTSPLNEREHVGMFNYSCEIIITHHSIVGIRSHTTPQDCIGPLHECNNEQFKSLQYGFRQTVERFQHLSKMWTKNNGFEFDWMSFIKFCNRLNPVQVLILRLSSLVGSLRTFVLCRRFSIYPLQRTRHQTVWFLWLWLTVYLSSNS